jgi:NarL family two-component system response regulator LiaR
LGAKKIRVLIVDDHAMVAEAITEWLGRAESMEVVGVAPTGRRGIELALHEHPDVILMDFRLGDMRGSDATREIRRALPDVKVIMVTGEDSESILVDAVEAGCVGFVTKGSPFSDLVRAVHSAHEGELLISPDMLPKVLRRIRKAAHPATVKLTAREVEVLQLLSEGRSNEDIATQLFLSLHTARKHVQNIIGKLGCHSKLEAVAAAVRYDLVRLE